MCEGVNILLQHQLPGDTSLFSLGSIDIKSKVVFDYEEHMLKFNFCFHVNRTNGTT